MSALLKMISRASDVRSRLAGTVRLIVASADTANTDERWLVGYEAEQLLAALLDAAEELVPLLGEDALNDDGYSFAVVRDARRVADALRARRLALKLEHVEGRSDDEAVAFLAKAAELRGRT